MNTVKQADIRKALEFLNGFYMMGQDYTIATRRLLGCHVITVKYSERVTLKSFIEISQVALKHLGCPEVAHFEKAKSFTALGELLKKEQRYFLGRTYESVVRELEDKALQPVRAEARKRMKRGRVAFEAYCAAQNHKTYDNKDIPGWDALPDNIQAAWAAAAQAAIEVP